jgi:hypothetical protein
MYPEIENVTRATTSVLVAMILVVVLLGGPCLACASVMAGGVNHSCCHAKKGCQKPLSGSPADCISPAVDLAKLEQSSVPLAAYFPAFDAGWNVDIQPPLLNSDLDLPDPVLHSPPDLCLLHSVLTI